MNLIQLLKRPEVVSEANIAAKILKDPKQAKLLAIAFRHDHTIPKNLVARLGPKPTDEQIIEAWSKLIDDTLRRNDYGDLSADGKFDDWLTRLYINGQADFEDINGEGGDALGVWKALSKRGLLKPQDQDFNKFTSIKQLQRLANDRSYRDELRRIKDAEKIEKMKREKKDLTLIDNDRFLVTVPFDYGSCYIFNNSMGYQANFCTGSSSGTSWFPRYAPDGMIVSVLDKSNMDNKEGKWQFHAATNQLVNADQDDRGIHNLSKNDQKFAELFPGLMKEIVDAIQTHDFAIQEESKALTNGKGYDIAREIESIKTKFPLSYASGEKPEEPEAVGDEPQDDSEDNTPGTWSVTHIPSNRTAQIPADSKQHLIQKLTNKYPDYPVTDYRMTKEA
jgi:hypothetical protein